MDSAQRIIHLLKTKGSQWGKNVEKGRKRYYGKFYK